MAAPAAPGPTTTEESRARIQDALMKARKVAVGTHAGEEVRVRMMHPGAWIPDARKSVGEPMELVPANAYTAVGHLASALGLAIGLTWAGVGGGFYGVKDAVAKT